MSRLANLAPTRRQAGKRWFFYGPEGVGKTTLALSAPEPLLFDLERGADAFEVARYPLERVTLPALLEALADVAAAPHGFRSLVVDSVDILERATFEDVIQTAAADKSGRKPASIEDFGYGRGYVLAEEKWSLLLAAMERVVERGIHVIVIGHAATKVFQNPTGPDFHYWPPRLHDRLWGPLRAWCDVVGFAHFDDVVTTDWKDKRARGVTTGARLVELCHAPAWQAKTRLPLPERVELDARDPWAPFRDALAAPPAAPTPAAPPPAAPTPAAPSIAPPPQDEELEQIRAAIRRRLDTLGERFIGPQGVRTRAAVESYARTLTSPGALRDLDARLADYRPEVTP